MVAISRRDALLSTLLGAGGIGLRSLATGLPISFLLNPRRAIADATTCAARDRAQYVIFNTSGDGDPIGTSVPGTYDDPMIVHSADPAMAPTPVMIGGRPYVAAAPWSTLPSNVTDRTVFWHLMTHTSVHPSEPEVLELMGATEAHEMFPSVLAQQLAPCLGTVQPQPISLGAVTPSEAVFYRGAALPVLPPLALKATLTNRPGPLTQLQALRDATLNRLYDVYKSDASRAQKRYIDALVISQARVRNIEQTLLDVLSSIKDNGAASQILAAITLIQMNVSPVIAVHIPFGGDNHHDTGLALETEQTISGVAALASLLAQLGSAGLADKVTFVSLNVFGRNLGPGNGNGRHHNGNHQASVVIGKPFRGNVIGAVGPVALDYGALPIDSKTGAGRADADVTAVDTLASFGQTVLAAVGGDPALITSPNGTAKVIRAALA